MIQNPVLRGFNPDPSMISVNQKYYIAVSSFEWMPGVRVYESSNLIDWSYCTDIITNQLDLRGRPHNCSVWAPQLSYCDGLFYLLYSDVRSTRRPFKDVHNYCITSTSIHGPWSEPIYLNSSGFDPSLYHDEDGRKWLLNALWDYRLSDNNKSSGIVMQEYDPQLQKLVGEPIKVFDPTQFKKTEAPHIYKRNGYYYLITAEGGTGSGHVVTVARSTSITGPYEVDPHNPMLTSYDVPEAELQCAGHASLVETPEGEWYMAHLCTRPIEGKYAILGRETAIQKVYWDDEGWLRLTEGGETGHTPQLQVEVPQGYVITRNQLKQQVTIFEDHFNGDKLRQEWNTLRIVPDERWCSLHERQGYLRIRAGESPQSLFDHHLLAIRQQDFEFQAKTTLEYEPDSFLQMAGLMLYLSDERYLYAYVSYDEQAGKTISVMSAIDDKFETILCESKLTDSEPIHLAVEVQGTKAQFKFGIGREANWKPLGFSYDISFLSGGFTGNFVGIAVHDLNQFEGSYADFKYFHYQGLDE